MAAALALAASLLWGSGDFLGGTASRRFDVLRVLVWSQLTAVLLLWVGVGIGVATDSVTVTARALGLGAAGGVAGVIGLAAFYKALAVGPMALVPPIAAAGVVLPVAVGLASGDPPTAIAYAGLIVALVGVILASIGESPEDLPGAARRIAPSTLVLCLIAACGFAMLFVAVDAATGTSVGDALVATAGIRCGGFSVLLLSALALRMRPWQGGVTPRAVLGFALIGVFDTSANLLFAIATALGDLEVVAVLGSLYPAVTSMLAHRVLGERLGRIQLVGVVIALIGVALLAAR